MRKSDSLGGVRDTRAVCICQLPMEIVGHPDSNWLWMRAAIYRPGTGVHFVSRDSNKGSIAGLAMLKGSCAARASLESLGGCRHFLRTLAAFGSGHDQDRGGRSDAQLDVLRYIYEMNAHRHALG